MSLATTFESQGGSENEDKKQDVCIEKVPSRLFIFQMQSVRKSMPLLPGHSRLHDHFFQAQGRAFLHLLL